MKQRQGQKAVIVPAASPNAQLSRVRKRPLDTPKTKCKQQQPKKDYIPNSAKSQHRDQVEHPQKRHSYKPHQQAKRDQHRKHGQPQQLCRPLPPLPSHRSERVATILQIVADRELLHLFRSPPPLPVQARTQKKKKKKKKTNQNKTKQNNKKTAAKYCQGCPEKHANQEQGWSGEQLQYENREPAT